MEKVNRNIIYIFLILMISSIFAAPLFQFKFYESHDGEGHVARFAAYYQSFKDGQVPPRWAGNLNYGYGTPVFIFYYPLPGYIASAMHMIGISYENAFILIMITSFLLAPLFFYFWMSQYINKNIAFLGSIFYGLAPYHFLNMYVRGDIAEMLALVFVPLTFLFIEKYIRSRKTKFLLLASIAYGLLILSHNGVSLMFSPTFFLYSLVRSKNKKIFISSLAIFVLGLMLSSFFWIPALLEGKYVNTSLFIGSMYKKHFPDLLQLIYSDWGFGPDVRKGGGLSPQIGIIYLLLTVASFFIIHKQKNKKDIFFWLATFFFGVFITLSISAFIWERISILRLYQFPWRFTALTSFAGAVISCIVLNHFKNKKLYIACLILLIIFSIPFIKVKKHVSRDDNFYNNYLATTDYGAVISIWTAGEPGKKAKSPIELIGGSAKIENFKKKTNTHEFTINAKTEARILDNTHYFPGWRVFIDNRSTPIEFQDQNHRGLITFQVPHGKHNIKVIFSQSPIRLIADIVSLVGLAILLISIFILKYKNPRFLWRKKS